MENEERASWKPHIEKRWKVVRLTSLFEQALRSKPEEAKSTAQPEPMLVNP